MNEERGNEGAFGAEKELTPTTNFERPSGAAGEPVRLTSASKLLTPAEVSQIVGLSVETLAQWRSQKRGIQFVKISRNRVRYRQVDVDRWVTEHIVRVDVRDSSHATGRD